MILGPVNSLLSPGRNLLAIQGHNADQPSTTNNPGLIVSHLPTPELKVNAALRVASAIIVSLRPSAFNFDDAAGGARIYANTNGLISDSFSGSPAPNGWLANAAAPASSPSWQGLQMISSEIPGAGVAGERRFAILCQPGRSQPICLAPGPIRRYDWWLESRPDFRHRSGQYHSAISVSCRGRSPISAAPGIPRWGRRQAPGAATRSSPKLTKPPLLLRLPAAVRG